MHEILIAIEPVFELQLIALLLGAVALGIVVGALPGISATMGVALASPLTFSMDPLSGIMALLGIYCGAIFGGSISAILLGIPGTPGAVASALDGYPMTQRGRGSEAIGIAAVSSFFGGLVSAIVLAALAYPIASFALAFGPREYLALIVFAMTAMASLSPSSFLKGALTGFIGMFLATVGIDETFGVARFDFGSNYLSGGIPLIPVMIGLFAIPEVLTGIKQRFQTTKVSPDSGLFPRLHRLHALLPTQIRSSVIGLFIGAVPGAGADIAAIVSYGQGKTWSRDGKEFGTGHPKGLASAETANNAATGGSLIPLLTLGIPGGAVTAILLGTFMTHGLQPGPLLLENNSELVYQIFVGFVIANVAMLVLGLSTAGLLGRILLVPQYILAPIILILCVMGAYAMRSSIADVMTMIIVGLIGYLFLLLNLPRAPLALGVILGPMFESELSRTLLILDHWSGMLTPISSVIWLLTALVVLLPIASSAVKKLRNRRSSLMR